MCNERCDDYMDSSSLKQRNFCSFPCSSEQFVDEGGECLDTCEAPNEIIGYEFGDLCMPEDSHEPIDDTGSGSTSEEEEEEEDSGNGGNGGEEEDGNSNNENGE
mmetsp:Transcript_38717/g.34421  ORF Transcript_38717/g.34421 Transcript_38717/m.34421 type:complete len:104 (+) Transcript_38717:1624-1935(+)